MESKRLSQLIQFTTLLMFVCVHMWMVHHLSSEHHEQGYDDHHHAHVGHSHHDHPGEIAGLEPIGHSHDHHKPHPPQEHAAPFVPRKKVDTGDALPLAVQVDHPQLLRLQILGLDSQPRPPTVHYQSHLVHSQARPRAPPLCLV